MRRSFFRNSSPKELSNIVFELSTCTLLVCKRLGEETIKGVPTSEFERMKKELANSTKTLETNLNGNMSLIKKMKEILDIHSLCGPIKQFLNVKIEELSTEQSRVRGYMENIRR